MRMYKHEYQISRECEPLILNMCFSILELKRVLYGDFL